MGYITTVERKEFRNIVRELMKLEQFREMKQYIQHGNTTTLTHCLIVSYYSYKLALWLPAHFEYKSLIRGALLHDFYLYDWHIPDPSHKLHGFVHPGFALVNARKYFLLNSIEEDIILTHMWPLTLRTIPCCKEAFLVCIVDKLCSLAETLYIPITPRDLLTQYNKEY